jgi:hypothetical protein
MNNYGRIGSWQGTDVIRIGKYEYDTSSEIRPKKYIYAVYNLIGDGNTYLIKDDTVFAQLLNEDGDIDMVEERKYFRPGEFSIPKKYKRKFKDAEGEFTFSKETVSFNEDIFPKEKKKEKSENAGKRAAIKTIDDWIGFGMNATIEEILKGKS